MRIPRTFLSLPPSLLLLLATQLYAQPDASNSKNNRGGGGGADPGLPLPTAVRKMSLDEGEMFMQEYYAFAPNDVLNGGNPRSPPSPPSPIVAREANTLAVLTPQEEAILAANSSATLSFRPPFPRHVGYRDQDSRSGSISHGTTPRSDSGKDGGHQGEGEGEGLYRRAKNALARLQGRGFACPGGTHVCSNIDRPNYCCTDGTTCFVVENAPNAGNVGCCPEGQTCGGSVASCADGNTACPAEEGGGCCIPGFICADVGCASFTYLELTPCFLFSRVGVMYTVCRQ
jgi:progranulin